MKNIFLLVTFFFTFCHANTEQCGWMSSDDLACSIPTPENEQTDQKYEHQFNCPALNGCPTVVDITYDDSEYTLCESDIASVTWNGDHNIQEVTAEGYDSYSANKHIGDPIHGFENSGHVELLSDMGADPGTTRYFVCTTHPASKFKTTCPAVVLGRSKKP